MLCISRFFIYIFCIVIMTEQRANDDLENFFNFVEMCLKSVL